jgi:hypothetical protein
MRKLKNLTILYIIICSNFNVTIAPHIPKTKQVSFPNINISAIDEKFKVFIREADKRFLSLIAMFLEYSIKPYWSESILNRIISLQPISQHTTSHIPEFLRLDCTKLTQLKSLTVKLCGRQTPSIFSAFEQLNSLDYLSIECVPN